MRSAIACQKCRRSKVRCENGGIHTICVACAKNNKTCVYPPEGTSQRRESTAATQDGLLERPAEVTKKRKRTVASSSAYPKDGLSANEDVLDFNILTPQVWEELFVIFEHHFATELSFLHGPTFMNRLRKADLRSPDVNPPRVLLIMFLSLTVPHHATIPRLLRPRWSPKLQKHVIDKKLNEGEAASEYYAEAARALLTSDDLARLTLEGVQALLMLAYQEWMQCEAWKCFFTLGNAIRGAQSIGLAYLDKPGYIPEDRGYIINPPETPENVLREIKRRTFWSCFLLDNYLSTGPNRPRLLHTDDFCVQLPCSETAFTFGNSVMTLMLKETDEEFEQRSLQDVHIKKERRHDESMLPRVIRAWNLYGELMRTWSAVGGRRCEKEPPWSPKSRYYGFAKRLDELQQSLPSHLELTQGNLYAHKRQHTSRDYLVMHSIHILCSIALEREWLPFVAFRCNGPQGPIDENTLPPPPSDSYWANSARKCFESAKQLNNLISESRDLGILVQTPLTAFAVYTVVVCVLYCFYFPRMDPENCLCKTGRSDDPIFQRNWDRSWDVLSLMRERVPSAWHYSKTISSLNKSYMENKTIYRKSNLSGASPASSAESSNNAINIGIRSSAVAEGGGGLDEYKESYEKDLKEFWALMVARCDTNDTSNFTVRLAHNEDEMSEISSPAAIKSELGDTTESVTDVSQSQPQNSFKAINHNKAASVRAESENGTPSSVNGHPNGFSQVPIVRGSELAPLQQSNGYSSTFIPYTMDNHRSIQSHYHHMGNDYTVRDAHPYPLQAAPNGMEHLSSSQLPPHYSADWMTQETLRVVEHASFSQAQDFVDFGQPPDITQPVPNTQVIADSWTNHLPRASQMR